MTNQRGYSVAAHASAGEALESLSRDQNVSPDLIITDVNMPEMNGFRFLEALRAGGRRERSIPVVFLTARGMTTDRIEARFILVNRERDEQERHIVDPLPAHALACL